MSRSIFGWDLPPGCTMKNIDDAFGDPSLPPCCEECKKDDCDDQESCDKWLTATKKREEEEAEAWEEYEKEV